ncbi:MAG: biopolymer transporter ExbD [Bacteroidota bacterium]
MADVDTGGGGGRGKKGGGSKTKKKSTHIDMTAMVDVAFLLLTFFVLTATMANSGLIELAMPPKADDNIDEEDTRKKIIEDKIMTLVLDDDDKITYYVGITEPEIQHTDFGKKGLRNVILSHIHQGGGGAPLCVEVNNAAGCWDPIFVIKPRKQSRYKNLVDVLDEFAITKAPKYAIDKFTPQDSVFIANDGVIVEGEAGP